MTTEWCLSSSPPFMGMPAYGVCANSMLVEKRHQDLHPTSSSRDSNETRAGHKHGPDSILCMEEGGQGAVLYSTESEVAADDELFHCGDQITFDDCDIPISAQEGPRTEMIMQQSSEAPGEINSHHTTEGVPTVNRTLQNANSLANAQCGLSASCCGGFSTQSSWAGNKSQSCPPRGRLSASVNVLSTENDSLQRKESLMESFEEVESKEGDSGTQFETDTPDSDRKTPIERNEGEVIFASEHVCIYPSKNCRIVGRLSLVKHPGTLYLAWMPYGKGAMNEDGTFQLQHKIEFTGEETDRTMYAVHPIPLSDIKAISRHVSRLSWHYIIIVLNSGLTLLPFYFNKGGVRSFISALKEHAETFVIKSSSDPNEFLINSALDPIQRSLNALDLEDVLIGTVPKDSVRAPPCSTQDQSQLIGPESLLSTGISRMTKLAKETTCSFFGVMEENGLLGASSNLGGSISEPLPKASGSQQDAEAPCESEASLPVPARSRSLRSDSGSMADTEVGSFEFVDLKLGEPSRREKRPWGLPITKERWRSFFDSEGKGRLIHMDQLREEVFYGGVDQELRKECWKFLLGFYPPDSTQQERLILTLDKTNEYKKLLSQWQTISEEQEKKFCKWRERKKRIEKDVRRTDRSHPFFMDEEGEPLKSMRRILLTYAMYNFDLGYCQGMSDLLAPLVYVLMKDVSPHHGGRWLEAESETFWCFVALMDKRECNFHTDQRGMHSQLLSLEKLLRLLDPQLWTCFKNLESLNFFCCFRWVLILFKREFSFDEVLRLWEALWTNYRTEHFHLYMCIATLMDCRKDILGNVADFDMLIKYCVDLSHKIPLLHIMRQAEVLAIHAKPYEKDIMGGLDPTDGHT